MVELGYSFRHFQFDEERLYNHWLDLRRKESPEELIQRFHYLFIDGLEYPDVEVLSAVNRIVLSDWADQEFKFILNRCCYSLINYWLLHLEDKEQPTANLVASFQNSSYLAPKFYATERLRKLVQDFVQTEQYKSLERRARVANPHPKTETDEPPSNIPLGNLIPRYPFLYPYCLLDHDSSEMGTEAVKRLQLKREKQYEQNLDQYLHYRRRSRNGGSTSTTPVKNPTLLLRDEALDKTVRHFVGKVEGSQTYRDLASQCSVYIQKAPTYGAVKGHIYDYLTSAIDPQYGRQSFNPWLEKQLKNIQPQSDMLPRSDHLLVQTCGQLLDVILAHPNHWDNHVKFIDITHNVDVHVVVGMLLKIVLLCRNIQSSLETVKSHVSKKLAAIFKYYETRVRGDNKWLVKSLEYWLIALTVQFGRMDFSWVNLV